MLETPMDWIQFVTQVGFPAAIALALMNWTGKRIEKSEDRAESRENAMALRINQLEDKIEDELVDLVRSQGAIISDAKTALLQCSTVLSKIDKGHP